MPRLTPQDHEVGRRMTPETGDMRIMDLGHTYLIEFNQALGLPLPWQLDQKNPQRFTCLEVPSFRKTTMSVSQMMDMGFTTNWYPSHTEILDREGQVVAAGLWEVDKARCVLIKPVSKLTIYIRSLTLKAFPGIRFILYFVIQTWLRSKSWPFLITSFRVPSKDFGKKCLKQGTRSWMTRSLSESQ